jgi:hypothetical protein
MKFKFFSDAGHAWLKVPISLLVKLGINTQISKYSYKRGDFAYLEEDCDATTFVHALKANGMTFEYTEHISEKASKIRGYEPYKMETEDHVEVIYNDAAQMLAEAYVYLSAVKNLQIESAKRGLSSLSVIAEAKNKAEKCRNDLHLLSSSVQLTQNF